MKDQNCQPDTHIGTENLDTAAGPGIAGVVAVGLLDRVGGERRCYNLLERPHYSGLVGFRREQLP